MAGSSGESTEHDIFTRIWDGMVALTPTTRELMLLMDALGFHCRSNGVSLDDAFQCFLDGATDADSEVAHNA